MFKSPKTRVTEFFSPVAKAIKHVREAGSMAGKMGKAIARDPFGSKRSKKLMDMYDKDMASTMADKLENSKKRNYQVK